jgi:hypothetical protein
MHCIVYGCLVAPQHFKARLLMLEYNLLLFKSTGCIELRWKCSVEVFFFPIPHYAFALAGTTHNAAAVFIFSAASLMTY